MKRRHSTWLNSHGSEERTKEDTMNPASEALRYGLSELYVGRLGGRVSFRERIDFIDAFRTTHHMSVPHAVCGGLCGAGCCTRC
jgi:hypothetical protein